MLIVAGTTGAVALRGAGAAAAHPVVVDPAAPDAYPIVNAAELRFRPP
ncbi:MAG: hypothetical protein ACLFTG_16345 [Alphaproteobacteria bacterium]